MAEKIRVWKEHGSGCHGLWGILIRMRAQFLDLSGSAWSEKDVFKLYEEVLSLRYQFVLKRCGLFQPNNSKEAGTMVMCST